MDTRFGGLIHIHQLDAAGVAERTFADMANDALAEYLLFAQKKAHLDPLVHLQGFLQTNGHPGFADVLQNAAVE